MLVASAALGQIDTRDEEADGLLAALLFAHGGQLRLHGAILRRLEDELEGDVAQLLPDL